MITADKSNKVWGNSGWVPVKDSGWIILHNGYVICQKCGKDTPHKLYLGAEHHDDIQCPYCGNVVVESNGLKVR